MPLRIPGIFLPAFLISLAATALPTVAQTGPQPLSGHTAKDPASDEVRWVPDIVYGTGGDVDLQLNLARPEEMGQSPRPCIVIIHGGAWRAGHRRLHDDLAREFAKRGYVAATVSYRLCPQFTFPAQVEDVKCAVRYLRAHADEYNLDPQRIGAIGFSAGAHLSMMLGTLDPADGFEGAGGWAGQDSKVQAVVSFFGPADFITDFPADSSRLVQEFLGGTAEEVPDAYRQASPLTYVSSGDAPMLLFHGTRDNLVQWTQSTAMAEALTKAGVPGRVELLIGRGHGWMGAELMRTLEASVAFFDEHLKAETKATP